MPGSPRRHSESGSLATSPSGFADRWQPGQQPVCAVVGAGAVGCYFGAALARSGADVVLIGRAPAMQTIADRGLSIVTAKGTVVQPMRTASELEAARGADLVLICTKSSDTVTTASALDDVLDAGAIWVSMQNGVDNVDLIHQATGRQALAAAVYVAVEMIGPGVLAHHGRGDLIVGAIPVSSVSADVPISGAEYDRRARQVSDWFEAAGVPCGVSKDVRIELWTKLVMNCAVNAISALGQVSYGRMIRQSGVREMMAMLVDEAIMVARAEGIKLPDEDYLAQACRLIEAMPDQYSSTAQDIRRDRLTEIDSLNGHIARLAACRGLAAPLNQSLTALVHLRESAHASDVPT